MVFIRPVHGLELFSPACSLFGPFEQLKFQAWPSLACFADFKPT